MLEKRIDGTLVHVSTGSESIPRTKKISSDGLIRIILEWSKNEQISFFKFAKLIWACSQTNLQFDDFRKVFRKDIKRIFQPVEVKEVNVEKLTEDDIPF
jgi:hypothetical protein